MSIHDYLTKSAAAFTLAATVSGAADARTIGPEGIDAVFTNAPAAASEPAAEDNAAAEAYYEEFRSRFCGVMEMAAPEDGTVFSAEQKPKGGIYAVTPATSFMADATIVIQPSKTAPRLAIIWPQNEPQEDIALKPGEITNFDGNGRDAWGTALTCEADLQTPDEISVSCTGAYPAQTDKILLTEESITLSTIYEIAIAGQQTAIIECSYQHPLPAAGKGINFNLHD